MENFATGVRLPTARRSLHEALEHGRGVFKAFKDRLAENPELERAFRDKKTRVMGARIREWYDDLREAQGLDRLGEPVDEASDLVESDLGYSTGLASSARPVMLGLLEDLVSEAGAELPTALVAWQSGQLRRFLDDEDWVGVWVDDGEGGAIAGAAGRRETGSGYSFARVFFVTVHPDFRHQSIALALVNRLFDELGAVEGTVSLIDAPLALADVERSLFSEGFASFGARSWRRA